MAKKRSSKGRIPRDEIRRRTLKLLFEEHVESGRPKTYQIRALRRKIREKLGFAPAELQHNLEYLIQNGYILKEQEEYPGPQSRRYGQMRTVYKLSTKAIDLFEGQSAFSSEGLFAGIGIRGDHNIVQVGYGNIADVSFIDLSSALEDLKQRVKISEDLPDVQKIYVVADITAIQSQLVKPEPDSRLLNGLLSRVRDAIAVGGGLASLMNTVTQHWPF